MRRLFVIILLITVSSMHAQVINITGATANGISVALANDFLIPLPVGGDLIWDEDTCNLPNFSAGLFGNDYGTICFVHAKEEGEMPQHHEVSSYIGSRAFINGDNSSTVQIKWKNTGSNYATTDGHNAVIHSQLNFNVDMEVTGIPAGNSVTLYYWYDIFGGGSTAHEDLLLEEDSISVVNTMTIDGVQQFNNQFSFVSPAGLAGWNEWKNKTGTFKVSSGQTFSFGVTSDIDLYLNNPAGPGGMGFGVDQNDGIFKGVIYFTLVAQYPVQYNLDEMQVLYSLDIGSDAEISDPQVNGNEFFDPGDLYPQSTLPVVTPWSDDLLIFGYDPDPIDVPPFNPAPVGSGLTPASVQGIYFDLDGSDLLGSSLTGLLPTPGDPSISWFSDSCICEAEYLFVSFDDDTPEHYTFGASVPVNSNSPGMNTIYSDGGNQDELQEYDLDAYPASGNSFQKDIYSELNLHPFLAPDPAGNNDADDDIDALDMIPVVAGNTPCTVWYFSADHEARYNHPVLLPDFMLDPATIYTTSPAGPVPVIDSTHHALPTGTDIDAFEFAWVWDYNQGRFGLALLFSVDDNDTLTGADESGGLNPNMIYYSFMDGSSQPFSASQFPDDIDGLTAWHTSLNGTPAFPNPVWGTKTWTGAVNARWQNPMNWFPQGVPFDPEEVTVPDINPAPVIGVSGLDCKSLDISPGAEVILQSGETFLIKGL